MNAVARRLGLWFWYLIPANPILVRVVQGGSRRPRHLWMRLSYLGALLAVVLFLLFGEIKESASLADLAKGASNTFKYASITQLLLMAFLAPVFAAGAITQERDAQTFNILISTPLTNAQIVFGSLMSRLYFVLVMLFSGLPIFLMTMVYGGVTAVQVIESLAIAGATAVITGAIAITMSLIQLGTQRSMFTYFLTIGMYLLGVYMLGLWSGTYVAEAPANLDGRRMSLLTPLHPFLTLDVALNQVHAPSPGHLVGYSRVVRFALSNPSGAYVLWTLTAALLLTTFSVLFVRRSVRTGEIGFARRVAGLFRRSNAGERTRPARPVWHNPVAWREARTSTWGGGMLRWLIVIGGLAASAYVFVRHAGGTLTAGESSLFLSMIILTQFCMVLLIAASVAATSMTKEREANTLDILLTTMLTSRYILMGKLRGLVAYCVPLIAGPVFVLLVFGVYGLFAAGSTGRPPAVWVETALLLAALMVAYCAAACIIGLRVSLTSRKTVNAIMSSVAIVLALTAVTTTFVLAIVKAAPGEIAALVAPATPVTSILYMVNPGELFDTAIDFANRGAGARLWALVGCLTTLCLLVASINVVYKGLVREFDMTMRKQSAL